MRRVVRTMQFSHCKRNPARVSCLPSSERSLRQLAKTEVPGTVRKAQVPLTARGDVWVRWRRYTPRPTFPPEIKLHRKTPVSRPLQRRAEDRIRTKMFVKLSDPATGSFEITSTIDVSLHGAGVVTRSHWEREHDLLVQPIRGNLASRARVVHCEAREDGTFVIGLELYPTTEDWTRSGKLARKN